MSELERPGGIGLHWEQRGDGPLVVVGGMFNTPPSVLDGLMADLAADHKVVTYDLRGNGRSTRAGPYDVATDAEDLGAVIEAADPPAVVVALGYGVHPAVRLTAARPDLVTAIVVSGTLPLSRAPGQAEGGLSASGSVLQAFTTMYDVDHRAAMRTTVSSGNPNLTEDQIRDRVEEMVEYSPAEAGAARLRSWIADDLSEDGAAMGDRLWVLYYEGNPWFPAALAEGMRDVLPNAHFQAVEDGAISRPDLTAAAVRRITQAAPADA
ncbi:MAG: alpha/beta fold hydrolase [Solirubrobacteraceae bacterium]